MKKFILTDNARCRVANTRLYKAKTRNFKVPRFSFSFFHILALIVVASLASAAVITTSGIVASAWGIATTAL